MDFDPITRLFFAISNGIESLVTKIDVVSARCARIVTAFASVTRIVLWTSICDSHDDACTLATAVASPIVIACYLVAISAHIFRT